MEILVEMIRKGINCPFTSSCGRLFDAVASITGVRHIMTFEGQAPMELEMRIKGHVSGCYGFEVTSDDGVVCISFNALIRQVVEDLLAKRPISEISAVFHNTVAEVISCICRRLREETLLDLVVLSGGVFQNLYLLNATVGILEAEGFKVLTHKSVPANDSGISLGQAVIARYKACKTPA